MLNGGTARRSHSARRIGLLDDIIAFLKPL